MLRPSWLEGSVEQVRATEKCGLPSPAVDAEVPPKAERAGLHAYIHLVALPEPIVIGRIHRQRPREKHGRALQEAPAKHYFGGRGSKPAGRTLIRRPRRSAIKAASHALPHATTA